MDPAPRVLTIEAAPQTVTVDLARTAMIVVDMQNDFCAKGGWVDHLGVDVTPDRAPIEPGAELVVDVVAAPRHLANRREELLVGRLLQDVALCAGRERVPHVARVVSPGSAFENMGEAIATHPGGAVRGRALKVPVVAIRDPLRDAATHVVEPE